MKDPDLDNLELEEKNRLNKEKQMASIPMSPSKNLAAYVVVYRTLGMNKDIALACMEELMKRREAGDEFDFEGYIDEEVAKIPKPKGIDYAKIIRGMQNNIKSVK